MKPGHIKGALLEYLVRSLLRSCGFTNVMPDKLYTFENHGLLYINGKGAAHDADVLMNPPIQMPFIYPTQVVFECKAYKGKVQLPQVRNAFGLRNDLNDFEIVTKASLRKRQDNRRASYAIENRRRYLYQVGVASINHFSKPAFEFAANNKIPLISLSWFLPNHITDSINNINQDLLDGYLEEEIGHIYDQLKDRDNTLKNFEASYLNEFLSQYDTIRIILEESRSFIERSYVGLLESGDIIFLFPEGEEPDFLELINDNRRIYAEIHWYREDRFKWILTITSFDRPLNYEFYLPLKIMEQWEKLNYDKATALDLKEEHFSKLFIFHKIDTAIPFTLIELDPQWLNRAKNNLR